MSSQAAYEEIIIPMRKVFAPPPHLKPQDEDEAQKQYVHALQRFSESDLKAAWVRIRDRHRKAWWPPIADVVAAAAESRRHLVETTPSDQRLNGRIIDGQFQPWGGACQCEHCQGAGMVARGKPRPGFFKASAEQHAEANKLEKELNDWVKQRATDVDPREAEQRLGLVRSGWIDRGEPKGESTPYETSPPELVERAKELVESQRALVE